ncbi:MAG: methylated-DNA--[protein]-cysteine S-methyltransferase [Gracilibacteraceae bacterium]|jgi:methylated-DNA-[protein]-cysteine S-methyltransferase|nr:methylated-DNA--[protein]-cysteine S-methyltransferase [Gracilibacteraceae bacterium]
MEDIWFYDYPVGRLGIAAENASITRVFFAANSAEVPTAKTPLIEAAAAELSEYFRGERFEFDLPLSLRGTDFQISVWTALRTIPAGETRSYKDMAVQIGKPLACRAVGMANHRNPVAIIVPCHRVIGQNGGLVGYGGGLPVKKYLLEMEERYAR